MARSKGITLNPIQYPVLQPWDYLNLAAINGLTQKQAKELSGVSLGTWHIWLYGGEKRTPKKFQPYALEKLHRIASDMGWIKDEAIAA